MHLLTIVAFGLLFWQAESSLRWTGLDSASFLWTFLLVLAQPIALVSLARLVVRRTRQFLAGPPEQSARAPQFYHRAIFSLRLLLLAGFAATVFATQWPTWFAFTDVHPALEVIGDFGVLSLYFGGAIAIWVAVFPLERDLRIEVPPWNNDQAASKPRWTLRNYLDFNIRHHLLIVAVPLAIILLGSNITRGYQHELERFFGWVWAPELVLGAVAMSVFVFAPGMLRFIWKTRQLEPGPLRNRLERVCDRIGLRCRGLLVWQTDGLMINAAVMGVIAPVRYVLLSDALLASMTPQQIEAVFGHEAGHVRHRHIQHFLAFAFIGWLLVAGLMEGLAQLAKSGVGNGNLSLTAIEFVGIAATVLFWGIGFGWVSRRFERQADLFGARCISPDSSGCAGPCSLHGDESNPHGSKDKDRLCTTGAAVFASALDRVAALNGIAREEYSWRHSSIGHRVRSLARLAGDPVAARRFEHRLRQLQTCLWTMAIFGAVACVGYWVAVPEPAILQLQAKATEYRNHNSNSQ